MLLALGPTLMRPLYMYVYIYMVSKLSLDRIAHKTRCIYSIADKNVTTDSQEPKPVFPLGAVIQYLLIQGSW